MSWDFEERLNRLHKAREMEVERFDKACKVASESEYAHSARNYLLSKEWFEASEALLRECRVWIADHPNGTSIADEGLGRIEGLLHHFAHGVVPDPVRLATQKDGNPMWPGERRDIAMAVFYADYAKSQKIDDPKYNKTIRQLYRVDDRTVRRWINKGDEICAGIDRPLAGLVENSIANCGARYARNRTGRKESKNQ